MATPSISQSATTHNWLGGLNSTQSVLKPEIYNQLVSKYGDQNLTGFMEMNGSLNPVGAIEYSHFEDDFLHSKVLLDASGGGAAGATVALQVAAAYQYSYPSSAVAPYIVTGATNSNPLQNFQTIVFPNGVQAMVTAMDYTTGAFNATPRISTEAIPAVLTTDEIIIIGNQVPEGNTTVLSRNGRVNRYVNNLQISQWVNSQSGTSMGEQLWFEVEGLNGQKGYLWMYKSQLDEERRAKNEREMTLLIGKKTTNTTLANITGQSTNVSTEGLITGITNNGFTENYSSVTGPTYQNFETMTNTLDRARGAKENGLWVGLTLRFGIESFIRDAMKNGSISYGMFNGDKQKYINFGFDSFMVGGYTFHMKTYDVFNYQETLGATGQPYPDMGLVIPMDNTTVSFGPQKTKMSVPSMRINYLSQSGNGGTYSRYWETFLTGGVNNVYTEITDNISYTMRSHYGLEMFAANRFGRLVKS